MVEFLSGSKDCDDARAVLLKHYSSQCIAHAGYVIAIAIGLLGFADALPSIRSLKIDPYTRVVLISSISSIFLSMTIYILGRFFVWGYQASAVLLVIPKKENEVKIEDGTTATALLLLSLACEEYVKKKHKMVSRFYSLGILGILWLILFIVFLLIGFRLIL